MDHDDEESLDLDYGVESEIQNRNDDSEEEKNKIINSKDSYEKFTEFENNFDQNNHESNSNDEDQGLADLLNLIENDDENATEADQNCLDTSKEANDNTERKKIILKKDQSNSASSNDEKPKSSGSSIKIVKVTNKIEKDTTNETILVEKNTGLRLISSKLSSEAELNLSLRGYGKFYMLTDLNRRMMEIKNLGPSFEWFTIFVLGQKTESKCSAKGNNYVVWQIYDLRNLEKQQDVSLFLFGNAYKEWWKSSEFDVFALIKPEFLDSNKNANNTSNSTNASNNKAYFDNNASNKFTNEGKNSNWNKFASKKLDLSNKITLSIKANHQLIYLGVSKDIKKCQSYTKQNSEFNADSKKCKNLVNVEQVPYCTYHCVKMNKEAKKGLMPNKNKYSMSADKPTNSIFKKSQPNFGTPTSIKFDNNCKFVPNTSVTISKPGVSSQNLIDKQKKTAHNIKAEILLSLNSSIAKESMASSPVLSNTLIAKANKKSDQELLALLDGKELDKEEIKKLRLAEQASTIRYQTSNAYDKSNTELKKLFSSKLLLPTENNCNNSISSKKLVDLKKSIMEQASEESKNLNSDFSNRLKEKYEDNKKKFGLSSMQNHKDILKEIKQKDDKDKKRDDQKNGSNVNNEELSSKPISDLTNSDSRKINSNKPVIADFLKKRIDEIKRFESTENKSKESAVISKNSSSNNSFDLELYIGDSLTSKKLLDANSKYEPKSTSEKRKFDESSQNTTASDVDDEIKDRRAKRAKMIEDLLKIKSTHAKETMDPAKNPQLKSYYDRLQVQEDIDNKLCELKNREVNAVTCKICSYTSFKQSDFCKFKRHTPVFHKSIQRFFKCKNCGKKTSTLDKICPTKPCVQCQSDKYEICAMKEEDVSIKLLSATDSSLNQESEMLGDCGF